MSVTVPRRTRCSAGSRFRVRACPGARPARRRRGPSDGHPGVCAARPRPARRGRSRHRPAPAPIADAGVRAKEVDRAVGGGRARDQAAPRPRPRRSFATASPPMTRHAPRASRPLPTSRAPSAAQLLQTRGRYHWALPVTTATQSRSCIRSSYRALDRTSRRATGNAAPAAQAWRLPVEGTAPRRPSARGRHPSMRTRARFMDASASRGVSRHRGLACAIARSGCAASSASRCSRLRRGGALWLPRTPRSAARRSWKGSRASSVRSGAR